MINYARSLGLIALPIAMSGLAASLLDRGRTAHSRFRLPVPLPTVGATCNIKPNSPMAELLQRAHIIVWDEAPTAPKTAVDAIDRFFRDLTGNKEKPFGGKLILMGRDWRQTPPVLPRVDSDTIASHTLRATSWWGGHHLQQYTLAHNMRADKDASFAA